MAPGPVQLVGLFQKDVFEPQHLLLDEVGGESPCLVVCLMVAFYSPIYWLSSRRALKSPLRSGWLVALSVCGTITLVDCCCLSSPPSLAKLVNSRRSSKRSLAD